MHQDFPIHLPPLSAQHLAEAMDVLSERRDSIDQDSVMLLAAFNGAFLLGTGKWWRSGGQIALEVSTEDGARFLDPSGEVHASADAAVGGSATRHHHPDVDPKALKRRIASWRSYTGLGLYFRREADSLDEEEIIEVLWDHSCHPFLGRRIVDDLREKGERFATVMPGLANSLPEIRDALGRLGVSMALTTPMPSRGERAIPIEHRETPEPRRFRR